MAIDSKHPIYALKKPLWDTVRDVHEGEHQVKSRGVIYLPATSGMIADGMDNPEQPGYKAYVSYRTRAHFPDTVSEAVEAMLGVMHHKPPVIELPSAMEPLREKATLRNESLEMLLRRINEAQLVTGRCGLLADLPEEEQTSPLPYIAMYQAEDIINWDQGRRDGITLENLNLVVLDETAFERQKDFEWKEVKKWRVLALGDIDDNEPQGEGKYAVGVFDQENKAFTVESLKNPGIRGNTPSFIPFTFINAKDIVPEPDKPPLLGLAKLVLTIYRGEADYRQNLFMQGQDTLVVIGAGDDEEELRIGSGGRINVPIQGNAKFIGVDSKGLEEQRQALENDYARASQKGGQLMDSVSRERESGDALKIRVAARTATLNQIALTGAYGLQHCLRQIATWIGANPEEVVVTPNLDFVDDSFTPKDLVDLVSAKSLGAPISNETIHRWLQNKDVTELEYEEEMALIEEEEPLTTGSQNPEELEDDGGSEDDATETEDDG